MNVYLDHAATTAVDSDVLRQMMPYFGITFGNASSQHLLGQKAEKAIDSAREAVAEAIHARYDEIYFTSGGTESDNWAVKGVMGANRARGKHIVTTGIEHAAVLNSVRRMRKEGIEVTYVMPDCRGQINADDVVAAIRPDTVLVSVMAANNEVGSLQPITAIGTACHLRNVLFHTDAVQAVGCIPIDVETMHIDLLSMSAHKFYGPKGVGALYVRKGVRIDNLLDGGLQERGLRAGTYNTPAIVGMGAAVTAAVMQMDDNNRHISNLRERFIRNLTFQLDGVWSRVDEHNCLPGIVNLCFEGVDAGALQARLDMEGIAVGRGSACNAGTTHPSHVLTAMGMNEDEIRGCVRFSFGRENTLEEVDYVVERLLAIVPAIRRK